MIIPILKKGDTMNTDHYHGIGISSCLSKINLKILNKLIEKYMVSINWWSINQCEFKTDHKIEDNLFVLHPIYESYVTNKNNKIHRFRGFLQILRRLNWPGATFL